MKEVTKPIVKDGREHIEYIPTQIVTEYFRHVLGNELGVEIRGVLYSSSQNASTCCVLFCSNEECCEDTPGWQNNKKNWLGLVSHMRYLNRVIRPHR